MTTTLGLPLIIGDELEDELVSITHDPTEPGHPLRVTRGQGPAAQTTSYDSVDIHHHAPAPQTRPYPPGVPGPLPAPGGAQGALGAYTSASMPRTTDPSADDHSASTVSSSVGSAGP